MQISINIISTIDIGVPSQELLGAKSHNPIKGLLTQSALFARKYMTIQRSCKKSS